MKELKKLLIGLAETFGTNLSEARLSIYVGALSDLPPDVAKEAINRVIADPKQKFFPLPAEIRERVAPSINPDHEAQEVAGRISKAISEHGYWHPEEARRDIGELGWLVVERSGGWAILCESTLAADIGTRFAQWREMAKSLQARAARGVLGEAPRIPERLNKLSNELSNKLALTEGKK
jgi:hypothetical protein